MTRPPSAEAQLVFLTNLQRLMAEGQFVATYKYALLLALADLAVEDGDDSGAAMEVSTGRIAEKFIEFYWRQAAPYISRQRPGDQHLLSQNQGRTAEIIRHIQTARDEHHGSLAEIRRDIRAWPGLVGHVDGVVRKMPLWKLQTVGAQRLDFLYDNVGRGRTIQLRPGAAYCLRHFHPLISELVRSAWTRFVRRQNHDALGTTADLSEFLFGSERTNLSHVGGILRDLQSGRCFYCSRSIAAGTGQVDHFIPWSRYASDLGHNFVLAHATCNTSKSDHLAAAEFLEAWAVRNLQHGAHLAHAFNRRGIVHHLPTTVGIATWAYQQTSDTGGLTWVRHNEMRRLSGNWRGPWLEVAALRFLMSEDERNGNGVPAPSQS